MRPFIKADDGASAEALLDQTQGLTPEATTEWRQRVAWMYYLEGDDTNARRVAATAAGDPGEWGVQAPRSAEHPSELQSLMRISYAVFCLIKQTSLFFLSFFLFFFSLFL